MKKAISSIVAAGVMFSGIATQTVSADVKNVGNNSTKAPISKPVSKEKDISVIINGKKLNTQYKPVMKNNRVLVPIQPIANNLWAELKWDYKTKKTTVTYREKKIEVTNGKKEGFLNGKKTPLDVPIQMINGKVYVPLKVISEGLGGKVNWDAKSSAVSINFQKDIILSMDRMLYSTSYNLVMIDNRILIPIKPIADHLGGALTWDDKTKKTTFTHKGKKIEVTNGKKEGFVNGKKTSLDVPAQIINGSSYVPLRFVSEGLGGKVNWDTKSNTVTIKFRETVIENYYYVDGKGKVGTPITYQQYYTKLKQGVELGKELVYINGVKDLTDGTIDYEIGHTGRHMIKGQKFSVAFWSMGSSDTQGKGFFNGKYSIILGNYNEGEHNVYMSDRGELKEFNSYEEALDYSAISALEDFGYADKVEEK
ncbi:copper amine oxidase N-terminal domain-containing protein [Bacillus thuringiensis]|uniref:copper amine oxidase N-terminal domain-containing protein n=1 Tax=Bacillus thuringiensis TaxID=1428 RepID=UPI0021D6529E|nr:copper amine oxidase N-terminal domain-containing protein [Bacillus thuringiensis]MCU7667793.1 copper amine oxidase N-terminal domain-containing protein [Bacillus thuringiensis]